jgi:hypothetical protein
MNRSLSKGRNRVLDIADVFFDHLKVAAKLRAGEIIDIEDDDGRVIARVEPIPDFIKKKPATKTKAAGLKTS